MSPDRVAEIITKKFDLLTVLMGNGSKCDVEFLFIQNVNVINTDRVLKHAKVFKDTNKFYEILLNNTVNGLKSFVSNINKKTFPRTKNIIGINDDEYEKFLNKVG